MESKNKLLKICNGQIIQAHFVKNGTVIVRAGITEARYDNSSKIINSK